MTTMMERILFVHKLHVHNTCAPLSSVQHNSGSKRISGPREGFYEWEIVIEEPYGADIFIGIVDATKMPESAPDEGRTWLGWEEWGWGIRANEGDSYHNYKQRLARSYAEEFARKECRVRAHLDMCSRTCAFSFDGVYAGIAWTDLPEFVYPAVSTCRDTGIQHYTFHNIF